jgi:hypothetical protein
MMEIETIIEKLKMYANEKQYRIYDRWNEKSFEFEVIFHNFVNDRYVMIKIDPNHEWEAQSISKFVNGVKRFVDREMELSQSIR